MRAARPASAGDLKTQARGILNSALANVDPGTAVTRAIAMEGTQLRAAGRSFDLRDHPRIVIIAIGKAATAMCEAAARRLATALDLMSELEAIVVSTSKPRDLGCKLLYYPGSHPTPNETSRESASAILDRLRTADAETLVLFLISGGASAMVELPVDSEISVADMAEFNRILVGSGLRISEMNVLRKHLSAVKGGRLAAAASAAAQCTLIVSDVPASALDSVGSGPSIPDSSTVEECRALYSRLCAKQRLPPRIERFFESASLPQTPKLSDPAFMRATWTSILSSADLAAAAASAANAAGFLVEIDTHCDEWFCHDAVRYLLDRSATLARSANRTCLISVGEVNLELPTHRALGRGGRNQHFALQCALDIEQKSRQVTVLSAGSDGIDGNSPAAGAIADSSTCARARLLGIDPAQRLDAFDSYQVFEALGDAIVTGPTGNNLRDLRLLLT